MSDRLVAAQRVAELEHQVERQARALSEAGPAADRIDAVRQLRMLTNALELIRPHTG